MNNIDKIFKTGIQSHHEAPSQGVWMKLENKLDADQVRKYKLRLYWLSRSSLIVLLLFIGHLTYDVMTNNKTAAVNQTPVAKHNSSTNEQKFNLSDLVKYKNGETPVNRSSYLHVKRPGISKMTFAYPERSVFSFEITLPERVSRISLAAFTGQEAAHPVVNAEKILLASDPALQTSPVLRTGVRKRKPFFLGLSFSPLFQENRMVEMYDFDDNSVDDYKDQERSDMSWSAIVTAEIPVKRNISLLTGVGISEIYSSIKPLTAKALKADDLGNYNFAFASSLGIVKLKNASNPAPQQNDTFKLDKESTQQLQYISIPLAVKWTFRSSKKFRWNVIGGISSNFITKGQVEVVANDGPTMEQSTTYNIAGVRKHFLSGIAAVGVDYDIGRRLVINATPQCNFGLTPINRSTPVRSYITSLQLNTGISYRF
jgi:hypothetical protein